MSIIIKSGSSTDLATVKAASTPALSTDPALVVVVSPNSTVGVSGTITANIGTAGSLALDSTLTGGTQQSKITDGSNVASVKAASIAAVATDKALVVAISPNNTIPVSGAFFPVTQPVSGTFWQTTQPVSGTFFQSTQPVSGTFWQATQPVSGPLTDTQLRATAVPVSVGGTPTVTVGNSSLAVTGTFFQTTQPISGTIAISNFPATQAVTGTFFQATQPVSGTITANVGTTNGLSLDATLTGGTQKTQLVGGSTAKVLAASISAVATDPALVVAISPNNTIPVTGTFFQATQPVSGTFFQATQPVSIASSVAVTGSFWQATQPVSIAGTVAVSGPLTDTQLRAATVPVSGTVTSNVGTTNGLALDATLTGGNQVAVLKTTAKGTTGAGNPTSIAVDVNTQALHVAISGTPTVTVDNASLAVTGTFWQTTQPVSGTFFQATQPVSVAATVAVSGPLTDTQLRASAVPVSVSGTPTVTVGNASLAVTGTFFPATQPISATGLPLPTGAATETTLGSVLTTSAFQARIPVNGQALKAASVPVTLASDQGDLGVTISNASLAVTGIFFQSTQPVSGTITANAGTNLNTSALALDATLTGGTQQSKITDGSNTVAVKAASTAAVATDKALVVAISPNNTIPVSGTFFQATQPVSGTVTANAGTGTMAISAASLPLPSGAATSAKQPALGTAGTASADVLTVQGKSGMTALVVDGSGVIQPVSGTFFQATQPISGTVTANIGTAGSLALDATLTGGTQKTKLVDTGGTNVASVSAAGALKVDGSGVTQPVSGTVTANAGSGTMAVSAATLPLPSGASTAAKQPALGTAGAASADVITVQGVTSMTALKVDGSGVTQPVSGTFFQATQPVSGTVAATQSGTWTVQPGNTANTTPWLASINAGGNTATVKAASTAPAAADPALVVTISPNTVMSGPADLTSTGALGSLNAAVSVNTSGFQGVGFQLSAGTLVGTIVPEISFDGGTTWVSTFFDDPVTGNKSSSIVFGSSNTATARTIVGVGGSGSTRVRVSAFTSGTANITVRASTIEDPSMLAGGATASSAPPVSLQIGGSDGTNLRTVLTDTTGRLVVTPADGYKTTYSAAVSGIASASSPTDIFTITGSATKTIRVTKMEISGTQTTGGIVNVLLIKRSTANSSGTSAAATAVPMDSTNAAATATVLSYTGNPTLGSTVGNIAAAKVIVQAITGTGTALTSFDFGIRNSQAVVLRGTSQVLAFNLGGVTATGGNFNFRVEWTEES